MRKALESIRLEEIHLNIVKAVDDKPTANIILMKKCFKPSTAGRKH